MARVGSILPYARPVEEGVRPGRKGRFFMRAAGRRILREMPRWLDEMSAAIKGRWSA